MLKTACLNYHRCLVHSQTRYFLILGLPSRYIISIIIEEPTPPLSSYKIIPEKISADYWVYVQISCRLVASSLKTGSSLWTESTQGSCPTVRSSPWWKSARKRWPLNLRPLSMSSSRTAVQREHCDPTTESISVCLCVHVINILATLSLLIFPSLVNSDTAQLIINCQAPLIDMRY